MSAALVVRHRPADRSQPPTAQPRRPLGCRTAKHRHTYGRKHRFAVRTADAYASASAPFAPAPSQAVSGRACRSLQGKKGLQLGATEMRIRDRSGNVRAGVRRRPDRSGSRTPAAPPRRDTAARGLNRTCPAGFYLYVRKNFDAERVTGRGAISESGNRPTSASASCASSRSTHPLMKPGPSPSCAESHTPPQYEQVRVPTCTPCGRCCTRTRCSSSRSPGGSASAGLDTSTPEAIHARRTRVVGRRFRHR